MNYVLIVCSIGVIISMYVLIRNNKVYKFRTHLIDLIYKDVGNNFWEKKELLDKYTYNNMLYSFKPLKMECWFTDDELKSLGYERKDI